MRDLENLLISKIEPQKRSTKKEQYDKTKYWTYCENTKAAFQNLYMFCFALAKQEQSRNIEMETAVALWSVLLVPRYPLMSEVLGFIDEKGSYKATNKDLWTMMLEFCETVNPNLCDYEGDGAWPTLLDDFVIWKKGPAGDVGGEVGTE
ncbi:Cullin binding-domain-containing protein [Collybia nuda]|uniref:Defective in cullin neddylation protein n=1 Tax=Collybia nuda TaxID=64659 RepID=A0A9P5YEN1_9AGAR|nr:Cullin binding-domain-containing protein [Collybia nuda]